jgi:MoxR-like ATPase
MQAEANWFRETFESVRREVAQSVVGQTDVVEGVLAGLAANGHVLLEGMPGLGKTLLVRTLSEALHLGFSRIQFTPDMMPADVTGTQVLGENRAFEYRPGPIFANIVLADEINRATPKTQSAMLEAMQERAVTAGGKRHLLPEPFLVMATQNPVEQEGTYPLPEAQLDRFFLKLIVPYPTKAELAEVVLRTTSREATPTQRVATEADVLRMRTIVRAVVVDDEVMNFALGLVVGTHPEGPGATAIAKRYARYGASPRGAQSIVTLAKVYALLAERQNASKGDVLRALKPTLRHRVLLNFEAEADGITADTFLDGVAEQVGREDRDPVRI